MKGHEKPYPQNTSAQRWHGFPRVPWEKGHQGSSGAKAGRWSHLPCPPQACRCLGPLRALHGRVRPQHSDCPLQGWEAGSSLHYALGEPARFLPICLHLSPLLLLICVSGDKFAGAHTGSERTALNLNHSRCLQSSNKQKHLKSFSVGLHRVGSSLPFLHFLKSKKNWRGEKKMQ